MYQKDKDMKLHGFMSKHFQWNGGIGKDIDFAKGAKNALSIFLMDNYLLSEQKTT